MHAGIYGLVHHHDVREDFYPDVHVCVCVCVLMCLHACRHLFNVPWRKVKRCFQTDASITELSTAAAAAAVAAAGDGDGGDGGGSGTCCISVAAACACHCDKPDFVFSFFDNSHGGLKGSLSARHAAAGREETGINKPRWTLPCFLVFPPFFPHNQRVKRGQDVFDSVVTHSWMYMYVFVNVRAAHFNSDLQKNKLEESCFVLFFFYKIFAAFLLLSFCFPDRSPETF